MSRRGMKWAGAVLYASLLIGATVYFFHLDGLDEADQTSSVIGAYGVLLGVPTVLFAVWRLWRGQSSPPPLEEVAGQLAIAVGSQWDAEATVRRVNDPYPLPVTWRAADEDLAEPWSLLTDLARAWPGGPPCDPAQWPQCAAGLADESRRIGEVFTERVPTRRLVILGEPGAGKSVLLLRLLQDLLARRADNDPVPVIFSLASWNPDQPLKTWLADQLRRTHPGLRAPAPATASGDPGDLAQVLVETRRILPLLDGFDEIPPGLHQRALDALNRALPARQPVVVAARAELYRAALHAPGAAVRLNGAAAIQLLPLDPDKAAAYLRRDAGGPSTRAASRWDAVAAELGTDSPVGQALSTPLGLFLARTIYNPRPGRTTDQARHPDELCNVQEFPDRAAVDQHLFNAFIPAAYAPDAHHPPRWNATQAHIAFVTLARFLEYQRHGNPDLAWWEVIQVIQARGSAVPSAGLRWSPSQLAVGFAGGLMIGLGAWWLGRGLGTGLVTGLVTGLGGGLMAALVAGLRPKESDLTSSAGPVQLLRSDRDTFMMFVLTLGLMFALVTALVFAFGGGLSTPIGVGIIFGGPMTVVYTLRSGAVGRPAGSAWLWFVVARIHLTARRRTPWRLMPFLQDAHEHRGVLRQVGAVYQFRHIDLQRHLAQQHHR